MSSQRVAHDVAHNIDKCDELPCFASLSLNERCVTTEALPQTQPIEAFKRDANGMPIDDEGRPLELFKRGADGMPINAYTQKKHDENLAEIQKRNTESFWLNFYDENVRPEKRNQADHKGRWPPNPDKNGLIPHFMRRDQDPTKNWAYLKEGCPDTMELALGNPEMQKWIDALGPKDGDKLKEEKMKHNEALRRTYELAKNNATPDNLEAFREALHMDTVKDLPAPPGFLHYTYLRNLEVMVSAMPSGNKFFENKYFGPEWEDWREATQNNQLRCNMKDANSPRDAWDKFLGIYRQDPNKERKTKKTKVQPQEPAGEIPNNQPKQTPSSSGNGEQGDADRLVDGFFATGPPSSPPKQQQLLPDVGPLAPLPQQDLPQNDPAKPQEDLPAEPKGSVTINPDDILKLLRELPPPQ